ncbi:unnamed protein product [Didymodactylos carnosus]|uniref:Voltage-gated hydrogen channel 1 n=1 Tax=Didymodactylos carnosus TaxID=1234261 RepID=A0A815BNY4_9BILA|nr:unnamed protein product [Didymodactylos carnosus]CAF4067867.1 unnamed protein product [Didymodactylos carnosus]
MSVESKGLTQLPPDRSAKSTSLSIFGQEPNMEMVQPDAATAASSFSDALPNTEETPEKPSSPPSVMKKSKWAVVKTANHRILPQHSIGAVKLRNIIEELNKISVEERGVPEDNGISVMDSWKWVRQSRRRLANFVQQPKFHYTIIILIIVDLMIVFVDLVLAQLSLPCLSDEEMELYNTTEQRDECLLETSIDLQRGELFLYYFSVALLSIFLLEVFISFYAFGWRHYKNPLYLLDAAIVFASFIMELYFHFGNVGRAGRAAAAFVVLRLWKIVRAIHAIAHSISLKNRILINKIEDARTILKEEKEQAEKTLEKQEIKIEYLMNLLRKTRKLPTPEQIDAYVENAWQERTKNDARSMVD